jgi:hypothetical protein
VKGTEMTNFTFEVYKIDRRTKAGNRLVRTFDLDLEEKRIADNIAEDFAAKVKGTEVKVFQTYVERTNLQSGNKFMERYDTPYFCSPSSDAYWD